ncbi:uncharacterized protein TM35_000093040 [Trypanosoma theileri]|uniref:Transglutaminase n=1 Tax=Trypanosoma theileri TaxID=67003 RepID=A0A1X0NZY0_9TRYP|nr:uncharacterized protein TM35_000093040 [Trypanosoma theileri]ORC90254.1 hypothetical protein TM35_000093040 [Trypanosoma theileri]
MTTMFVQLRRVVYLLVLLQCCACVVHADDDAEKKSAVNFLKGWIEGAEKHLGEGRSYQDLWDTTVVTCAKKADEAKKVAEKTIKLVDGIVAEEKNHPGGFFKPSVSEELANLVENASREVEENSRVFREAMDTVEKARKLVLWSSGAMQNMQDMLETQNNSRVYYTGVLKGIPEDNRTEEQELLIERSERIYNEINGVYQHLLVISKRSIACSRETNQRVMETKNKMHKAVKLFEGMKEKFDMRTGDVEGNVREYDEAVRESLKDDLKKEPAHEETSKDIVGRASESTIGGASPLATKNRTVDTTDLKEKLEEEKKKEEERLEQKKKEEEQEVKKRIEERKMAAERRRKEEERQKQAAAAAAAAEAQRVKEEEERKEREKQAQKVREEKAKRDAEEKARLEAERKAREEEAKKKKKDGSSSPALVHSSLILLVLSVLGCTLVC